MEYNGAHGVHLYDIKNINELGGGQEYLGDPLTTSSTCADFYGIGTRTGLCFTRPNQQWTSINNRGTQGFSHYNGLNLRFQTQNIDNMGLTIVTNYTYAHSQDNLSSTFSESVVGSTSFVWPPDFRSLRFTRNEPGSSGNEQWEVSADGTNTHRRRGNWTPDGKYFVFTVFNAA